MLYVKQVSLGSLEGGYLRCVSSDEIDDLIEN